MSKKSDEIIDDSNEEDSLRIREKIKERLYAANEKTFCLIEDFIAGGYEENLANLLLYLPEERRKASLEKLPEPVCEKVSSILKTAGEKKNSDPEVMSAVGTILKNADFYGPKSAEAVTEGEDVYFMEAMTKELKALYEVNPLFSLNLESYLVNINLITRIDDRAVQKVLRETTQEDLAKSLKLADENVKDKIFRNMSHRAVDMLREDMEFMGPVRRRDVLEAQKKIIYIIKELHERGEIVLPDGFAGGFGDEFV